MTEALLDPFRHNAWANKGLLAACSELTREQLDASADGTYGSIISTLGHTIGAEGRYRFRLSGEEPNWPVTPEEVDRPEGLVPLAEDMAAFWEGLLATGVDPDREIRVDASSRGRPFTVRAGVLLAQTLNHGNEHRSQVCTVLTTIGVEPPNLDGWAYGAATGGYVELPTG